MGNGVLLRELQVRIGIAMATGTSLSDVEDELIDPQNLNDEEKAALWLYAWSYVTRGHQRAEALRHLEGLRAGA